MTNTEHLLERARNTLPRQTDYALAKAMHMTQSDLLRIKKKQGFPGNRACFRLAEMLNLPPTEVIALVEQDRARTPATKDFWSRYAPRILPTTLTAVAVVVGGLASQATAPANDDLYIMRSGTRRRSARGFAALRA